METIKMHNPYTGKSWEVVVPTPEMKLHPNAVMIIENGETRLVSRTCAAAMASQGSFEVFDPALKL